MCSRMAALSFDDAVINSVNSPWARRATVLNCSLLINRISLISLLSTSEDLDSTWLSGRYSSTFADSCVVPPPFLAFLV